MRKIFFVLIVLCLFGLTSVTYAHVSVKPNEVGIGKFQTFSVGVPNERETATVGVRLIIPEGLEHVSPNVKPGWTIEIKKEGEGHEAKVTELIWKGGKIPVGQRDDFLFSAKVPASPTTLAWKAYQTYEGGVVVSWDQDPSVPQPKNAEGEDDFSSVGPYSRTNIIDDLAPVQAPAPQVPTPAPQALGYTLFPYENVVTLAASLLALVFSLLSLRKSRAY